MNGLLHVLGGSMWRVPTVRKAKALGYRVLVTDINAECPAYAVADAHEVADITNQELTLQVAQRHGVDGILCDTTDVGVRTAAFVAQKLKLAGIGEGPAMNCTDKARMRKLTAQAGLPTVGHCVLHRGDDVVAALAAQPLRAPWVVKPVDNQSGRGVCVVEQADALPAAIQRALAHSRRGEVVVEERCAGTEYIVDAFGVEGQWLVLGVAAKTAFADNPTLGSRILYLDGAAFDAMRGVLEPALQQTVQALGLRSGLAHAEFFVEGDQAVPIDVAARGGGVMIYQQVLPHISGFDAMGNAIRLAMGDAVELARPARQRGACIEFLRFPAGRVVAIKGLDRAAAIDGVAAVHMNVEAGQTIGAPQNKDERPGFVLALAGTAQQAQQAACQAVALIVPHMQLEERPAAIQAHTPPTPSLQP